MNEKIICEVMFNAYKDLERLCNKAEERAWRVALGSINNDVLTVAEKIIRLNNEKIAYCNIKVIIDEAVKNIGKSAELKAYYIDGLTLEVIAEREDIATSTLHGKVERQLKKACEYITSNYDGDFLAGLIMDSKWLMVKYRTASTTGSPNLSRVGRKVKS